MEEKPVSVPKKKTRGIVGGLILILIGVLALAGNFLTNTPFENWFLPGLGIVFLAAGIAGGKRGLLIPGGILLGVGAGIIAQQYFEKSSGEVQGGAFLVVFALGWALITVLSLVVKDDDGSARLMWWPLIPGGILGLIGAALMLGEQGLKVLEVAGKYWPVLLILLGGYIILRRRE